MPGVKTKDAFKGVVASNNVHEKADFKFPFLMEFYSIVKNNTIQNLLNKFKKVCQNV